MENIPHCNGSKKFDILSTVFSNTVLPISKLTGTTWNFTYFSATILLCEFIKFATERLLILKMRQSEDSALES